MVAGSYTNNAEQAVPSSYDGSTGTSRTNDSYYIRALPSYIASLTPGHVSLLFALWLSMTKRKTLELRGTVAACYRQIVCLGPNWGGLVGWLVVDKGAGLPSCHQHRQPRTQCQSKSEAKRRNRPQKAGPWRERKGWGLWGLGSRSLIGSTVSM